MGGTALIFFVAFLFETGAAAKVDVPEGVVDMQDLARATIVVTFSGTVQLGGETKKLTIVQPVPSADDRTKVAKVSAAGGAGTGFSHEVVTAGGNSTVELAWSDTKAAAVPYEVAVEVEVDAYKLPVKTTKRGKDAAMLRSGPLTAPSAEIKEKAKALAKGAKNDLDVALRLAAWIRANVAYDAAYAASKADKPAAVVFQKRRGTCDELSHLFMSMARAVGIPAREVSGIAFSGLAWGFHSWAEVKLGARWVPVDPTNMQVGFVDATHVAFARDLDDARFEQRSSRLGIGGFTVGEPQMKVQVRSSKKLAGMLALSLAAVPPKVPPGWAATAVATVKNTSKSHLAGPVELVLPEGVACGEPPMKTFLVAPGKETKVSWKVTAAGDVAPDETALVELGAFSFPRAAAEAGLKVAAELIGGVGVGWTAEGKIAVAVTVASPYDGEREGEARACLFPSWEMTGTPACASAAGKVPGGGSAKFEVELAVAPQGDFALKVTATVGELAHERIVKVKGTQ